MAMLSQLPVQETAPTPINLTEVLTITTRFLTSKINQRLELNLA